MHKGGEVDHFNDNGHSNVAVVQASGRIGAQPDERGAQLLPLCREGIRGIRGKVRFELTDLLAHPLGDSLEEWFQRLDDLLPIDRGFCKQRNGIRGQRHSGFCGQHCAMKLRARYRQVKHCSRLAEDSPARKSGTCPSRLTPRPGTVIRIPPG